jgi:hypothetical protein
MPRLVVLENREKFIILIKALAKLFESFMICFRS